MWLLYLIATAIVVPLWIWLLIKLKMWDIDRRNKRDALTELHLETDCSSQPSETLRESSRSID